jgi:tetratricopeptide (TPR) repeat protein
MGALQRHEYQAAAEAFEHLLKDYPAERSLLDRARVYLDICERELGPHRQSPRTVEERLTAATAALNVGDEGDAERLAASVLEDAPELELALYILAVVQARRGEREAAFALLQQAVTLSPDVRVQAVHDPDFEALREMETFRQLVQIVPATSRRVRRGRAER